MMFSKPTVFIIGAGASWHYGYPTGEQLVKSVVTKANQAAIFFEQTARSRGGTAISRHIPDFVANRPSSKAGIEQLQEQWLSASKLCSNLSTRLEEVSPLVIDYFLGQNAELQEVGKLMIAWVILECEARYMKEKRNHNRPVSDRGSNDNWHRFLLDRLVSGCTESKSLLANDVTMLTFNYDVSLEWHLYNGLEHISLFQRSDIDEFFRLHPVLHVYGRIRDYPGSKVTPIPLGDLPSINSVRSEIDAHTKWLEAKTVLDAAYSASKQIRTIGPAEKGEDKEVLDRARGSLRVAERLYILGYGFDERNSRLLGFSDLIASGKGRPKAVLFTNYRGND
jgi:hypothetical protein